MKLFGFEISRAIQKASDKEEPKADTIVSPIPRQESDGASIINTSGYYGTFLDIDGSTVLNDLDLIQRYRRAALQPECDVAIDHIVNEAIYMGDKGSPISLTLEELEMGDEVKEKIQDQFTSVLSLLNFAEDGADIFRQWYIDGRLFYHLVIDTEKPEEGIKEIRAVDPLRIRKIREVEKLKDSTTGLEYDKTVAEYFVYSDSVLNASIATTVVAGSAVQGVKMDPNSIIYIPSGLLDSTRNHVISHLHKAMKVVNEVNMMENALVIYRLARAPERRIFYIDVGSLPKGKAEEYVQSIMSKYRNKLVYNAQTGEIVDDRKHMSILEDFWLPRREGGKGTEIDTLPGGENLGEIDDIVYFQRKLYKALNVPITRLDAEAGFMIGRATEISREEVTFQKFIDRLRRKFSYLFLDILRIQLLLTKTIVEDDWKDIKEDISINYSRDNYFAELKNFEILRERLDMFSTVEGMIGKYFSEKWARSTILGQTEEDIKRINDEIAEEKGAEESEAPPEEAPPEGEGDETPPDEETPPEETPPEEETPETDAGAKPKGGRPTIPSDFRLGPSTRTQRDLAPDEELPELPNV
jgi:hypothetical protein